MTWAGFWWPAIVGAILSGVVSTVVGFAVGLVLRHVWRVHVKPAIDDLTAHTSSGAVSASQAADDASATRVVAGDVSKRLRALEGSMSGIRETVSASLGHRIRDDLRFRELEAAIARLEGGSGE